MNSNNNKLYLYSSIFILFFIWNNNIHVHCQIFKVTDFGAVADEDTDNKSAFEKAWDNACKTEGGTLVFPQGSYGLSGATFSGPCNGITYVALNGNLVASHIPIPNLDYWIMFSKLSDLSIYGHGTFDGNGAYSWEHREFRRVTSLKLMQVTNVLVRDITSLDSKMFHIVVHQGENVAIDNVRIKAPEESPNTDGIHVGLSTNVRITNSQIGTGDDCVSIGHGSTNVNINGVSCGPGHGISIGSLGRDGEKQVRGVTVMNCTFTGTTNGARIKTIAPSPPNKASDITFQDIVMNKVKNPVIIDQHYCPDKCQHQGESSVSIENVKFINIRGNSVTPVGVKIDCSKSNPCKHIKLDGVVLTYEGQPAMIEAFNSSNNVELIPRYFNFVPLILTILLFLFHVL